MEALQAVRDASKEIEAADTTLLKGKLRREERLSKEIEFVNSQIEWFKGEKKVKQLKRKRGKYQKKLRMTRAKIGEVRESLQIQFTAALENVQMEPQIVIASGSDLKAVKWLIDNHGYEGAVVVDENCNEQLADALTAAMTRYGII